MSQAKLKAEELIEKFRPFAHKNFNHINDGETEKAIKCAIVAVDEILDNIKHYSIGCPVMYTWQEHFWQEVKTELLKKNV